MSTRRTASSQKKSAMARKKTPRRGGSRGRRRSSSFLQRYPRWAWWIGGTAVIVLYVFLFYHFFVGPTGFRWRALYGDAEWNRHFALSGQDRLGTAHECDDKGMSCALRHHQEYGGFFTAR